MIEVTGVPPNWMQISLEEARLIFENGGNFKGLWYHAARTGPLPFALFWRARGTVDFVDDAWWNETGLVKCICFVEVE